MSNKGILRLLRLGALTAGTAGMLKFASRGLAGSTGLKVPSIDALKTPPPIGDDWPFVSIIVPARNEVNNLPDLLPTLLGQHYPNYEVIVVDDQSEDATPQILEEWAARDSRLHMVRGKDLPREEGWLGKPHAMYQGAQAARGSWLLFTDADTRHEPLSLSSCVAYAMSEGASLFSILPCYDLVSPSERLIMPVTFMGIMWLYPADKVNDPSNPLAIANGQYLLIRREVYDAIGGAERVKGQIVEDLELGKAVKRSGFRLLLADARDLVHVRMYTNLGEIWQGWSKNTVIAMRDNPAMIPLTVVGLFLGLVSPFIIINWVRRAWRSATNGDTGDKLAAGWVTMLAGVNLATYLSARRRVDKALDLPLGWTFTQPVGGFVFALIMLYSIFRLATGKGVVWKGRTYHDS